MARFAQEVAGHQTLVAARRCEGCVEVRHNESLGDPPQAGQASAAVTSAVATATRLATDSVGPSAQRLLKVEGGLACMISYCPPRSRP